MAKARFQTLPSRDGSGPKGKAAIERAESHARMSYPEREQAQAKLNDTLRSTALTLIAIVNNFLIHWPKRESRPIKRADT